MKMNIDDEISMIQSLQSIYNMFKVGNYDILGINMTVLSKKGIYVRIYRKMITTSLWKNTRQVNISAIDNIV